MYIYNITFVVEDTIEKELKEYLKNVFIPKMLSGNKLQTALTSKVNVDGQKDNSYSVQFTTSDKETLDHFISTDFYPIINELHQKFSPKVVYFATELDVIDQQ